ncbi:glycosyltransferase family 4 protein [Alkaliphilus transvaalensis]|uniref:glycosyltransferase family 4 protein n=1 Tax=Alkaliphilus transvaalensis TaxID=114628 RepID=UPI00047EE03A|nr:glycosyltransferase family 4 protein [Alkaliphilus transvaalensis]
MKILFYVREDYLKNLAGDSIQMLKTKEYLEKLGIDITVSSNPNEDLEQYDLIHLYNTIRVQDTYSFFINAHRYKKKVVISPIYWNYIDYTPKGKYNDLEQIYWKEGDRLREKVLKNVDRILPSAEIEMKKIKEIFNVQTDYTIIPNGVDEEFAKGDGELFIKEHKMNDFILCVGRVCPHKNQLSLAEVAKKMQLPLVLVGPVNDLQYFHKCIKTNSNIIYLSKINHLQLASIYKAARIHALVSWYEIPGLANLEAALAGCNIVTTEEGSTKEYFIDYAKYVDPKNIVSIEDRINEAWNQEKNHQISEYIKANYLWDIVAEKLLKVYKELLE